MTRVLLAQELGLGRWHAELLGTVARSLLPKVQPDIASLLPKVQPDIASLLPKAPADIASLLPKAPADIASLLPKAPADIASLRGRSAAAIDVYFALPDPVTAASALPAGAKILPAPHHMPGSARRRHGPTRTFADILADAGWDDSATLSTLIASWQALLELVRPDVIIADHAPTLLLAARGRWPVVQVGLGFGQPPTHMAVFPSWLPASLPVDVVAIDAAVLAVVSEVLGARAPITLPAALTTERSFVTCLESLDPWRPLRGGPALGPIESLPPPLPAANNGAIVAYLSADDPRTLPLLAAIAALGRRCTAYVRDASADVLRSLAVPGVTIVDRPLAMTEALRDAALVLHHGGAGTIHQAVAAGRPQLLLPRYLEQSLNAHALARRGLALVLDEPASIAQTIEVIDTPRSHATAAAWAMTTAAEIIPGEGAAIIADTVLALAG